MRQPRQCMLARHPLPRSRRQLQLVYWVVYYIKSIASCCCVDRSTPLFRWCKRASTRRGLDGRRVTADQARSLRLQASGAS